MPSIRLVSVNIERSKHLERVTTFLKKQQPDVLAVQECMESDVALFRELVGEHYVFTPLCLFNGKLEEEAGPMGQAIFSKYSLEPFQEYYAGEHDPLPTFTLNKMESVKRIGRALTVAKVHIDDVHFRIATTHFTWTPNGNPNEDQARDLAALQGVLKTFSEVIITGDFNAPRGKKIFDTLATKYKDNIPATYTTSIDPLLHRAGALQLMVDGLFTTPGYLVSDVELHNGVSDHCAITATIRGA